LPFGGNKKGTAEGPDPNVNPPGAAASSNVTRAVYPCTIYHNGRLGHQHTLYAETSQARLKWKAKLEEAIGLRKAISKSWKVCYSLAAPGDQAASLTRAWNELYGLIMGYKSLLTPRIITIITRYN